MFLIIIPLIFNHFPNSDAVPIKGMRTCAVLVVNVGALHPEKETMSPSHW